MKISFMFLLSLTCLFISPDYSLAARKKVVEEENQEPIILIDTEKELKKIFKAKVLDFFPVKDEYPAFFEEVKKQIPTNAELLEVYLPRIARQEIERNHYDNVLNIIYFYRMPQILHKRIPLQKLQLSFVCEGLEAVYESYPTVEPPAPKERKKWEEKMYEYFIKGKSVYINYKKNLGALDHKYSLMMNLHLSEGHNMAFFMSHYPFINNSQIYFLSSSVLLTDNSYYQTMKWTRNTLDDFIEQIPLEYFPGMSEEK